MFGSLKPLGLAVALAAAIPQLAVAGAPGADAALPAPAVSGDANIVVRDGATGRLRAATADEAQALHSHARSLRRAQASPATTAARSHPSGARGARLTDDFMSYTVVVRNADGSLVELCVEGAETTAKVLKSAPVSKTATLPTE